MKKYLYLVIIFSITLFACYDVSNLGSEDNFKLEESKAYLEDEDFIELVKIDALIKREILNGTYRQYRDFISDQLNRLDSYCNILVENSNSIPDEIREFIHYKCERRKHFEKFISKHPSYLRLSPKAKVALQNKVKEELELNIKEDDLRKLLDERRLKQKNSSH